MPDINDIQKLNELEQEIEEITNQLNEALEKQADAEKMGIDANKMVNILKNELKQKQGQRDSLKKILTILPN